MDRTGLSSDEIAAKILLKPETMRKYAKGYQPASERIMQMVEQLRTGRESIADPDAAVRVFEIPHHGTATPRDLLKKRREELGISLEEMAQRTRFKVVYIRDVEDANVRPNEKFLRKAAKILDLDAEVLMAGSDHPQLTGDGRTFGAEAGVATTDNINAKNIPLISMAQAGELHSYEDVYDYEGVIEYAKKGPKTFAVRIRGDSMEPRYPDGTIAIVEPDKKLQTERRVITKLREGSVLFKQLQFQGDVFRLVSLNPLYAPIAVKQEDIEWMYRVVRTQREEDD